MQLQFIDTIEHVGQAEWDGLWPTRYPFTRYAFLHALEHSKSTCTESGWQVHHFIGRCEGKLVFAMPMYLKTHSYGEYVFDWAWADAYARVGLDYFPKLVSAVPFTPSTGPRWAASIDIDFNALIHRILEEAEHLGASSFHCLFPNNFQGLSQHKALIERHGCQFHWFNQGYNSFDDYLSHFSSRKRKNIRKERAKVADFDIQFLSASDTTEQDWQWFYTLYHRTYLKRSGRPGYLSRDFFSQLAATLGEQLILAVASHKGKQIAGAVYIKDDDCLYGRYWGTSVDIDGLHFETCYYRGIEYAIEHGLQRFDPGAQGEHKIQRGFQAVTTCSYHWIAHSEFRPAIAQFCAQEKTGTAHYLADARQYLPFKEGFEYVPENILLQAPLNNSESISAPQLVR